MATVFKPYVGEHVGRDGLTFWMLSGEEVQVDGRTAVRSAPHLISDDRESWHTTREAAVEEARRKILSVSTLLAEQAARLEAGGTA